jgi:hypothetical protein
MIAHGAALECALVVDVYGQREPHRRLASEPVGAGDLQDACAEARWNATLRRGRPEFPLRTDGFSLRPLQRDDGRPHCTGFVLDAASPAGDPVSSRFPIDSLDPVAERCAQRLLAQGVLAGDDVYTYKVRALPQGEAPALAPSALAPGVRIVERAAQKAPPCVRLPLAPLLERSTPVDAGGDADLHPVFYTADALARSERFSRRGAERTPAVETGCVLVGALCSCPDSGEMFVCIVDALEATDTDGTTFSLSYSSATWARLQAILRARAQQQGTRAHRILGQAHGHSFLPPGEPCAACATAAVCGRTTAFLSTDDLRWCRAVFPRQPWQASHVFGLTARGEPAAAFYGQHGGRLRRRGYRVLREAPEFPDSPD